jgi:hypothetical protein
VLSAFVLVRGGSCWSNAIEEVVRIKGEHGSTIGDRTLELMRSGIGLSEVLLPARQEAEGAASSALCPPCTILRSSPYCTHRQNHAIALIVAMNEP